MNPLLTLTISAMTFGAPAETPTPDPKLVSLVQQLGHKSFNVREAAARDLANAGRQAVPALTDGMKDKDIEIAERCKKLLPLAVNSARNKLIIELLKEPSGSPPKGLPGLSRFLEISGDDKAARRLYADMMNANAPIVEALETNPTVAARLLAEYANQCVERAMGAQQIGQDPYEAILACRGEVALFFFVRAHPRFDFTVKGDTETMRMLRSSRLRAELVGSEVVPCMKKLFLNWLVAEQQVDDMHTAFKIAQDGKMLEAVPLAIDAIKDVRKDAGYKAYLMLDYLVAVGGKDHLKDLEPLLKDESGLGSLKVGNGPTLAPQLRDVALAVSIRMAGQKPADFGFHADGFQIKNYREYYGGYGFINDTARTASFAKWRTWVARDKPTTKK